jgi:hypothetical protein
MIPASAVSIAFENGWRKDCRTLGSSFCSASAHCAESKALFNVVAVVVVVVVVAAAVADALVMVEICFDVNDLIAVHSAQCTQVLSYCR